MRNAIVIHLYYQELWDEFRDKLKQLDPIFDLYITICNENEDITDVIKSDFPNAIIIRLPNKGMDIGPFIKVLHYIIENKKSYEVLFKMHTKKSVFHGQPAEFGINWRTTLVDSLIGSNDRFNSTIEFMNSNTSVGLSVSESYLYEEQNLFWMSDILNSLEIEPISRCFAAGTMFAVKYPIYAKFFETIDLEMLYSLMNEGYNRDLKIEHAMERIFSFIVTSSGYDIVGI